MRRPIRLFAKGHEAELAEGGRRRASLTHLLTHHLRCDGWGAFLRKMGLAE
jgi:hypothetical protein